MEKPKLYTPEELQQICNSQLEDKIKFGFHTKLDISETSFRQSYQAAINDIVLGNLHSDGLPTLVEPRIPFFEQAQLLDIPVEPLVFYRPVFDRDRKPYGVWVKVIGKKDELGKEGLHFDQVVKRLPSDLRPATPYEGIGINPETLLDDDAFVIFPNGTYEDVLGIARGTGNVRALTLERFLGTPRITQYFLDSYDGLGGVLAAYK